MSINALNSRKSYVPHAYRLELTFTEREEELQLKKNRSKKKLYVYMCVYRLLNVYNTYINIQPNE